MKTVVSPRGVTRALVCTLALLAARNPALAKRKKARIMKTKHDTVKNSISNVR
jgi:hypothetical protein